MLNGQPGVWLARLERGRDRAVRDVHHSGKGAQTLGLGRSDPIRVTPEIKHARGHQQLGGPEGAEVSVGEIGDLPRRQAARDDEGGNCVDHDTEQGNRRRAGLARPGPALADEASRRWREWTRGTAIAERRAR